MATWLKSTGKWGGIIALIALLIAFVKQLIALVGTIMFAVKALILLAFIALFLGVGLLVFTAWNRNKKKAGNE